MSLAKAHEICVTWPMKDKPDERQPEKKCHQVKGGLLSSDLKNKKQNKTKQKTLSKLQKNKASIKTTETFQE